MSLRLASSRRAAAQLAILFAAAGCEERTSQPATPPGPSLSRLAQGLRPPVDSTADLFLGQMGPTLNTLNLVDGTGLQTPEATALDTSTSPPRLYVVDYSNSRVLAWANAASFANGAAADKVFGQSDFYRGSCNEGGSANASTLCNPRGVAVDGAGNVYIADTANHRVLQYNAPYGAGDTIADRVFGQNGSFFSAVNNLGGTASASTLYSPMSVSLDSGGNLFVADYSNHRILKFNSPLSSDTVADVVLGQGDLASSFPNRVDGRGLDSPAGVAIDRSVVPNRLYVADTANHRVLGWPDAAGFANGAPATLVIGQADFFSVGCNKDGISASTLCSPRGLAVDSAGNLYVADGQNNRVLGYATPFTLGKVADKVWGQTSYTGSTCNSLGRSASTLCAPYAVAVSPAGDLYVADYSNHRVLRYMGALNGDTVADQVFGQGNSFVSSTINYGGLSANGLYYPRGVAVDGAGNVYIADGSNHRVLQFNAVPLDTIADRVLGQAGFATSNCALGQSELCYPSSLAVDPNNNVWVGDEWNYRVLGFQNPVFFDRIADRVVGVTGYVSSWCAPISASCNSSMGVPATDSSGNLYLADTYNHRVLRYNNPFTFDSTAERVLGQGVFSTNARNFVDASGLNYPWAVHVDRSGTPNRLYVADSGNSRVLAWASVAVTQGEAATKWFGQVDGVSAGCNVGGLSPSTLCSPYSVTTDAAGNAYIADTSNSRVLEYNVPFGAGDTIADRVFGQSSLFLSGCNSGGLTALSLCSPRGLSVDPSSNLFLSDASNHRVLKYNTPLSTDQAADAVLGQSGFTQQGANRVDGAGLSNPADVALDTTTTPNRLFVVDYGNSRVLGWSDVTAFENGAPATLVIGQPDLNTSGCNSQGLSASSLCYPLSAAVDGTGRLYVADSSNSRVLMFDAPFTTDAVADGVIGQPAYATVSCNQASTASASTLCSPGGVAADAAGNVWVADTSNNRVLGYLSPRSTNTVADQVLGQADFVTTLCNSGGVSASSLCAPVAVSEDRTVTPVRLYVADTSNHRVLEYDAPFLDRVADLVIGQTAMNFNGCSVGSARLCTPRGVTVDGAGNVHVGDSNYSRVLQFTAPKTTDQVADRVFGQTSYTTGGCNVGGAGPTAITLCSARGLSTDSAGTLYVADYSNHRVTIYFANNRPTAAPLVLGPSGAKTADPLVASYSYLDVDADPESGTEVRWYRNGVLRSTYDNLLSVPASATARGEAWSFTVRPRDGIDFGTVQTSATLVIANTAAVASSPQVSPSSPGTDNALTATYGFSDADGDGEATSEIRWYLNNLEQPALLNSKTVAIGLTSKGQLWSFTLRPGDGIELGTLVTSPVVSIVNTAPVASGVGVSPASPQSTSSLSAVYGYSDADGDSQLGSELRWYRNGVLQVAYNDLTAVPPPLTLSDQWYYTVRPRDGVAYGTLATSTTVIVGSSAPAASNLAVLPASPRRADPLTASYTYSDPDGQPQTASQLRWYRNGVLQAALNNQTTVAAPQTKGASWHFTVQPCDSTPLCGALQTSPAKVILNTAPTASGQAVTPAAPRTGDVLTASYVYADVDSDVESGSEIRWYRNGVEQAGLLNSKTVASTNTARGQSWYFTLRAKDGADFGALVTSPTVSIGNTAPVASALLLSPLAPKVTDALTASWTYGDPDGDAQTGTEVRWYQNGVQDLSLVGATTVPPSKLVKGAQWYFTVRPRDGTDFGAVATSSTVTVVNSAPAANNLAVSPALPLAAEVLTATYSYADVDGDLQSGSELHWFRDGVEVSTLLNLVQVPAGVTAKGQKWSFSVRPRDGFTFGVPVTSPEVSIANSAPVASALSITPAGPRTGDNLLATYAYSDRDGDAESGSEVRWFKNGSEQAAYADFKTLPMAATTKGDSWYLTLRPKDGVDLGTLVTSAPVIILNTAPSASGLTISPLSPKATDSLVASYVYSDADTDAQQGSELHWYKDGAEQTALAGLMVLPAGTAKAGETWYFTVRPRDGVAFGTSASSTQVIVGSSAPVATALAITPFAPRSDDSLTANYLYTDPDGSPESGSEVRWLKDGLPQPALDDLRLVPGSATGKGEVWSFTVRPRDGVLFGALQSSPPVTIGNSAPAAANALIDPAQPTTQDSLVAVYGFTDPDGDPEVGSELRWFRNGLEQTALNGQLQVPASATSKREVWYYRVRPRDGSEFGQPEVSSPVFIANSPPVARAGPDQNLSPVAAITRVSLNGSSSTDPDGDVLAYSWMEGSATLAQGAQVSVDLPLGLHTLILTVSDGESTSTDEVVVDLPDQKPLATVPSDFELPPGWAALAGAGSDGLGRTLSYSWVQRSGDPVALVNPGKAGASFFGLKAGLRTFELTVTADSTPSDPKTVQVSTRNVEPWAEAPARQVVLVNSQVTLDGQRSSDPNADPLSYAWALEGGAGSASLAQVDQAQSVLTPTAEGLFGVTLVVSDSLLASAPSLAEVLAIDPAQRDHAPVANPGADGLGEVGSPVLLDGKASYDVDGDPLTFRWRKMSGPAGVLSGATTVSASFRPSAAGQALFGLVVGDGKNQSAEVQVSFEILDPALNRRPMARVGPDLATYVEAQATLDGSKSVDPEGDPLSFSWTQLSGPRVELDDPSAARPTFTALRPGALRFALRVNDGKASSAPGVVTVLVTSGTNRPPLSQAGADQRVLLGPEVQLDATGSSDPDGDALQYVWTQLLGPPVVLGGSTDRPTFAPPNPGRFRFRLTALDAEAPGFPDEVEVVVSTHGIDDQQPVANAGPDQEVPVNTLVTLDGTGSTDPDPADRLTFEWVLVAFPTGSEPVLEGANSAKPSFTPTVPGPYQLRLRVSDGDLISEPAFVSVLAGEWASGAGCGCAAGSGLEEGWVLLALLGLWALRRTRRLAPVLFLALLLPLSAQAAKPKAKSGKTTVKVKRRAPAKVKPQAKPTAPPLTPAPDPEPGPEPDAPPSAPAPTGVTNPYLEEARKLYLNFQFEGIISKLEFALAVKGTSPEQKLEIYKLMAMTYLSFDDGPKAEAAFVKLLELRPGYELAGGGSPKIRSSFLAAQKSLQARLAVKLEHQPPQVAAVGESTSVDVQAVAGADRVASMTLHYRPEGGSGGFSQLPMSKGEGGLFSATVPNVFPGPAGVRTIEYFVRARDGSGALLAKVGEENQPLRMKVEAVESAGPPVYKSPLFWSAVGVVAAGAVASSFLLRQDARVPAGTLGIERLK